MQKRRSQRGVTLVELMIVVAMIGILAAIALPQFFNTSQKSKARSEVAPVFADLRTRMEQYLQENGAYPPSLGETTLWPASPTNTTRSITTSMPTTWTSLRVRISGNEQVYCGYTWVTGAASASTNIGAVAAAAPFNFTAPASAWYYLLARCNMDGNSTVDSYYVSSSVNPAIVGFKETN